MTIPADPIPMVLLAIYLGGVISQIPVMLALRRWGVAAIVGFLWPVVVLMCLAGVTKVDADSDWGL